jgi:hypothetical protein
MQGLAIRIGINGDGRDAEVTAGTNEANGNFAAIGNEKFLKHKGVGCQVLGVRLITEDLPYHLTSNT